MVQSVFPIVGAREELGFTPTRAVRADIDVRTGEGAVGEAIGQGALAVAGELQERSVREERLRQKNRDNLDSLSKRKADQRRKLVKAKIDTMKLSTPPEKWEEESIKIVNAGSEDISGFDFSPQALAEQQVIIAGDSKVIPKKTFADATRVISAAAVKSAEEMLTDAYRLNLSDIPQRNIKFIKTMKNNGVPAKAIVSAQAAAKEAGEKLRSEDEINKVHAAIELASTTGDFDISKELAKNPIIPETKQTSLRTAISTAEKARNTNIKDAQTELVNKTTSTAVREYFANNQTVANLNQQHEAGLIKDSGFIFMIKGLQQEAPDNTDPFAAGKIRRANAQFFAGAINREEADTVILENYTKLNAAARANVVADLEDTEAKIIATAKTNAYSEGGGLMSRRFVGIRSEEDLIDLFRGAGLSDKEKKRINRRFTVEVNNRDLYERAVEDRFKEMRKENISDGSRYRSEGLSILLQYQRRKQLTLEQLEVEVAREQQKILLFAAPVIPVKKLTTFQRQAELEKIRELKKLAK